ncbi:MAG TPA: NDP-sugar synthase [Solirubrobacterales bacterium]|nr:NDP-sugar synthase [Solirubrobacterales bacterium]
MQAIVLVGGEGTRLRPLTSDMPKPALTLVDRPFLAYAIEWLAAHGVGEVVLACGFLPEVLREALEGEEERTGVAITYVAEPEPLGTAGAIRYAAEALGDRLEDSFLTLNGDVLADLDLSALLRAHRAEGEQATIALRAVEDSSAYGLVRCDTTGRVLEFLEKTGEAAPGEINAGAYVLERSALDLIPAGRAVSIEREVFPRLVGKGLHALLLDGYWMDIGTPDRYLQASWDILEGRVATRVQPTARGTLIADDAEIDGSATLGDRAVVSSGCRIAAGAEVNGAVLLAGCTVGAGARVESSILAPGVEVAPRARLVNAVVGRDERVPA